MPVDVSLRCSRCEAVLVSTTLPDRLADPATLPFVLEQVLHEQARETPCGACDGRTRAGAEQAFRAALRSRLARAGRGGTA